MMCSHAAAACSNTSWIGWRHSISKLAGSARHLPAEILKFSHVLLVHSVVLVCSYSGLVGHPRAQ